MLYIPMRRCPISFHSSSATKFSWSLLHMQPHTFLIIYLLWMCLILVWMSTIRSNAVKSLQRLQYNNKNTIPFYCRILCKAHATNKQYKVVKRKSVLFPFFILIFAISSFTIFNTVYDSLRLLFHVHIYNAMKCLFLLVWVAYFTCKSTLLKFAVISVGRIVRTKNART